MGFTSNEEKALFIADWNLAVQELTDKTEGRYIIVDDINKAF